MDIGGEFTTTVNDIDGNQHEVIIRYKGYYLPAKIYCLPDKYYPAEGEIELKIDFPAGYEFDKDELEYVLHEKAWEDFLYG